MSSWILTNESINKIVNSIYYKSLIEFHKRELKYKLGIDTDKEEDLKKLGQLMTDLNYKSVNYLYDEDNKPRKFIYSVQNPLNIFQFLKSLECFLYQSCDGDFDKEELHIILTKLKESLKSEIIQQIPQYNKAKWE